MHDEREEGQDGTTGVRAVRKEGEQMSKMVDVTLVKRMLGLIQASIDDGDGFDQYEWLNFLEQMPTVELCNSSERKERNE